ncbi:nucleoid-associated protein YgaU [Paenibacillus jamilae]|uniref:LysM peptidoglycan-binding domain-containing protein n=1 Tax=Paenibacillus polymyxa TaxID=1406 RepID=UPI001D437623|nr:LysM peptidoglycan-binding domain-containing protein [Paenibacillus polymyxa]MBZ6443169.1 LysM peptidoglycan-binding domain-containing protein [Paenibacillus polymyxa]MBZ6453217.1 LysM peptidoglycan-binding domain-containing protein [Paenibacillus polymyxa]MDP9674892.1 nucleoid-associated protein YgaU [Paenibacillus jamilae]
MQFWLKYNNGAEVLWLPVNPEGIKTTMTHGFEDVEISNLGEYTIIGNQRLREFSFSSFFPRDYNAGYCSYSNLKAPREYVAIIERWMRSGKPARFIITGTSVNFAVTIRSFEYEERGGEPGDIYYTLSLKEHVFIDIAKKSDNKKLTGSASKTMPKLTSAAKRPNGTVKAKSYTVKAGDSLWKIAQRADVLGNGDRWRELYAKNKSAIGPNPNVLKPGQKLVIP